MDDNLRRRVAIIDGGGDHPTFRETSVLSACKCSEAGEFHNNRVSAAWLCQAKLIAGGVEPSQEFHIKRVNVAWLCQAEFIAGGVEPS